MIKKFFHGSTQKVCLAMVAMFSVFSTSAFADASVPAAPKLDTSQVTSTFTSIGTTVLSVIGTVAATAVAIMGAILIWKYGRKMFGMIAK